MKTEGVQLVECGVHGGELRLTTIWP